VAVEGEVSDMELAAVLLARALAWVEPADLNSKGSLFYPDLAKAIVARYNFQGFPQKVEDFDEAKGVTFTAGHFGGVTISQFVIYTYGLLFDTQTSTDESKRLLEDALIWATKEFGLTYKPSTIRRWQYASHVTFYSKFSLTSVSPAFQRLADSVSKNVALTTGENLKYELTNSAVDYDQLSRKHPLGPFSIQRRDNTPFSENKYFSNAPLPTDIHIKILEQFESDLSSR
jgi:hypothetical protein